MTYKTRKRIWPVAVVSLAVFGLLAAAVALYALPAQTAQAHGCDDAATPQENAACIAEHVAEGLDPNDPNHEHAQAPPNQDPELTGTPLADVSLRIPAQSDSIDASVAFSDPDEDDVLTYSAESNNTGVATVSIDENSGMMVVSTGTVRGQATITVTATDGDGASVSITFTVRVSEGYTLTAVPMQDSENPSTYLVEELGEYTAKFSVMVGGSNDDVTVTITAQVPEAGGITVTDSNGLLGAGFNQEDDLEGSLTIKSEDDDDSRAFEIEGACETPGAKVTITVEDDDLDTVATGYILCEEPPEPEPGPDRTDVSDAFTVASYGDWEFDDVTDGFVLDVDNGNTHRVNAHHNETGLLSRDEPVVHDMYTLGVSDREMLRDLADGMPRRPKDDPDNELTRQEKNAYVEEGQRTIEVLAGEPHVQLTVTSMQSGPAYIRFLDSNMEPFSTDVDEDPAWQGASVVGLDEGRLELNNEEELSRSLALAYDQYNIVTPGVVPGQRADNSYLTGAAGTYNQGAFRFFSPCPAVGHHFYVEVYEASGKYLQTTEKVVCVDSPRPGPTGLEFTVDSQEVGEGELTYRHALNADEHTVLLVDAHSRTIVASISDAPETVQFSAALGRELNDGWRYHLIVVAHGVNDQYTADAVTAEVNWINNADAAPSTLTAGAPTRSHIVCQTGNDEVMALLADCDTNTAPMAVGSIAAQSVTVGQGVSVHFDQNFTDADTGDTLTFSAMSSDESVATVYAHGDHADITGVAVGTATITVTATDMHGESAMQTFMVTVTQGTLMDPSNVMASHVGTEVTITWEGGDHADTFTVVLLRMNDDGTPDVFNTIFDRDVTSPHPITMGNNLPGRYLVGVAAGQNNDDGSKTWTAWARSELDYQP